MEMTPVHSFSLAQLPAVEGEAARANLMLDGRPTGVSVPGIVLEAQYRCGEGYLLLTTENVPYEEAVHVLLLGPQFSVLDHVELAHPFAPGILSDLRPTGEGQLRFSFFGGDLWELTVRGTPRRLRLREAPTGVRGRLRRLLIPRWLVLERLR